MKTASWIIRNRKTKEVVCETFNPQVVSALSSKFEAIPILDYLVSINGICKKQYCFGAVTNYCSRKTGHIGPCF